MAEHIEQSGKATPRRIAERSIDTQVLIDYLRSRAGEFVLVTYDELAARLGRGCRSHERGYANLRSALKVLEAQERIVFFAVPGEGVQQANDQGIVGLSVAGLDRARNTAKRSIRKLACANYENLPNDLRIKHNATASILGVLAEMTKPSSVKRLEAAVSGTQQLLSAKATTEAMFK